MQWRLRAGEATLYLAATAIVAALVHLIVVLIAPSLATRDAFARLAPLGAPGATVALPRPSPAERLLPYADPAIASAVCRYDLSAGPIRVTAPLGRGAFASISFHSRRGMVFYALTDKAATHGVIEAVLATPEDVSALAAHDDEEEPSRDLRIAAPATEGFVMMRVFSELPSLYPAAEAQAKALQCNPEPIPR
jgi:uncharacterized membrane protein